jgi:translation initiation factor 1 (eIF-1/SUI1)
LASIKPKDTVSEEAKDDTKPPKEPPKKTVKKTKAPAPKPKPAVAKVDEIANTADSKEDEVLDEAKDPENEEVSEKIVFVEASKECNAFKTRANKIAEAVGSRAKVLINQEKPGKGNFVIRVSGVDEPIIELKAMKRPFPPLKALDMDELAKKVLNALEE